MASTFAWEAGAYGWNGGAAKQDFDAGQEVQMLPPRRNYSSDISLYNRPKLLKTPGSDVIFGVWRNLRASWYNAQLFLNMCR